ncbi:MAG: hypothetical protein KBD47_02370 [Candidatus Pacebacteria bacterium]|jgi:hypothetical protein|nr:hypothetical protein [Candidatus Paceibacterota bacterium]
MSIQWNKEVTVTDVAKFFNQEIDMKPVEKLFATEIDLNKCAQVAAMVAIFGVIPAFTYGTVLGTLEGQRVALLTDVTSLQAEVMSAARSIVPPTTVPGGTTAGTSKIITSVITDKGVYTAGSPVQLTFYSTLPASTTNIYQISLYSASGALVQNLATMSPYQGPNRYNFTIATSTIEKAGEAFTVRVTATKYNQSVDSNRIFVKAVYSNPKIVFVVSSATQQMNVEDVASDDQGVYSVTFNVEAKEKPVFIKLGSATRGTSVNKTGANYVIASATNGYTATTSGSVSSELTRVSGGVVQGNFVKLDAWTTAKFKLSVYFDSSLNDLYRMQLYSVNYNVNATDPNVHAVLYPTYNYQTNSVFVPNGPQSPTTPTANVSGAETYVNVVRTASIIIPFVLNNAGKQDIYIGKVEDIYDLYKNVEFEVSTKIASTTIYSHANNHSVLGDTQNAYIIKAGTSRRFWHEVGLENTGPERMQVYAVKKIYFSDDPTSLRKYNISSGLENLKVTQSF